MLEDRRQTDRDESHNFIAGVASAFLMQIGITMANSNMVLSLFINQLGGSNLLVGLAPAISHTLARLPQLFVAGRLEGRRRKMPYYIWPRLGRALSYLFVLVPSLLLAGDSRRRQVLLIFFLAYSLGRLLIGLSQVSRMDIFAKAIPPRRFGSFWGQRNLWGKLAAFLTSFLVGFILSEPRGLGFPLNYALLFGGGSCFLVLEVVLFSRIREPVKSGPHKSSGVRSQLERAPRIILRDPNYARFVGSRLLLSFVSLASPFYVIYAKEVLHAPVSVIGAYLPILTLSSILSNILWSRLADRRGNKLLMELSVLVQVVAPIVALSLPSLLGGLGASLRATALLFSLVFLLRGVGASALMIGNTSYLLLISPPERRPTYIGLNNSILGLASFLPALGGVLVDALGYRVVFGFAATAVALALPLVRSLVDARQPLAAVGAE